MVRPVHALIAALAVLAGCGSEVGLGPIGEGDDGEVIGEPDGRDDDGGGGDGDGGGWGDWDPGDIPDLAFVLGVHADDPQAPYEVVTVDLRGRVLDTWPVPAHPDLGPLGVRRIQAAGPGEVLVTLGVDGVWHTTFGDRSDDTAGPLHSGPWSVAPLLVEVWHGDLVTGTWTRRIAADATPLAHRVVATDRVLPVDPAAGEALQLAPFGEAADTALITTSGPACATPMADKALAVDLSGGGQERLWTADRWTPEGTAEARVWAVQSGLDEDGSPAVLLAMTTTPCDTFGQPPDAELVRWVPGSAPEVLDTVPVWALGAGLAWDAASGTVLTTTARPDPADRHVDAVWRWSGDALVEGRLEGVAQALPLAVLDPAHRAFALAEAERGAGWHEIVLYAAGEEVWRIDEVRQGLGTRTLTVTAGTVVSTP